MTRLLTIADFDGNDGIHHTTWAGYHITCYDHRAYIRVDIHDGDTLAATGTIHEPSELTPEWVRDELFTDDEWADMTADQQDAFLTPPRTANPTKDAA